MESRYSMLWRFSRLGEGGELFQRPSDESLIFVVADEGILLGISNGSCGRILNLRLNWQVLNKAASCRSSPAGPRWRCPRWNHYGFHTQCNAVGADSHCARF